MVTPAFNELYSQLEEYYRLEDFSGALELATKARQVFEGRETLLDYWRFSLLARMGEQDAALNILKNAIESGNWYSEIILRRSPSMKALQGDPRFEELIIKNQHVAEHDQASQFPFLVIRPQSRCQSGRPACPLLIGLHTNGVTAQGSIDFWKPAAELGWLVAALQSSQALMKGAYIWDDRQVAEQDVIKGYETISERYSINPWQFILAGHGLGGETAIWLTLKGSLETNFFLAVGPTGALIDRPDEWGNLFRNDQERGLRGYILVGDSDSLIEIDQISDMVLALNQAGIETELEIIPGAEHEFEQGYEEAIKRGINFLTG